MRGRTTARALIVLLGAGTLIVLSQLLAAPPGEEAATQLDASKATTTTSAAPAAATPTTAATTTTAPLPPITGPIRLDDRSKFDGRGVGPVEAGMTLAEAEQAAGRRFTVERADPACSLASIDGLPGLRVAVKGGDGDPRKGTVVRVEASDSTWATVSGVRVGSTDAEVKRAYGSRAKASDDGSVLTVSVKDAGQAYAVVFVMSERQVVTAIRSGEAVAAATSDGCG